MTIAVDDIIATIQKLSPSEREYIVGTFTNSEQAGNNNATIVTDENLMKGEPIVSGTKTPVRAIVELWRIGTAPEEIPAHLPHLSLSQVFDALSYYASHKAEINRYIELNRVPEDLVHPVVKAKMTH